MIILGINSYHPDSSAAIIIDGKLIAAAEEERFNRIKHFSGFPCGSVKYCLEEAGVSIKDVDRIAVPRDPAARIFKKALYALKMPSLARERLSCWRNIFDVKLELARSLGVGPKEITAKEVNVEHHRAHLASSFFVSGFNDAFILSMDAMGDFASTIWGTGGGNVIRPLKEIAYPHSLGFYYTALTQYLGFPAFGDEYKVMGLAALGEPAYDKEFEKILKLKKEGFELGLEYFLHNKKHIRMDFRDTYPVVENIFSSVLEKILGKRRKPCEPITQKHKDIACSMQKRLEETVLHICSAGRKSANLCLSGGVSFNCAANGKILKAGLFKNIYVPPAPGDAGLAIGAAFYLWHHIMGKPRDFVMDHAYWGPEHKKSSIRAEVEKRSGELKEKGYKAVEIENEKTLCVKIAKEIADGKIVGWFRGRMEFGPRALGSRSILADPRRPDMRETLNVKIKHREEFRPFAPSILEKNVSEFFEIPQRSPFMTFICRARDDKRSVLPAVVHADGTSRVQTVGENGSNGYESLLKEFGRITGVPVLLNTSFNDNEPIVQSPKEAIDCFLRTNIDILVLGDCIITR